MGLAQIVNALIMAKDNMIFPFVVMGRMAMSVIQGIRESFNHLIHGEFKAAAGALLDVYKRNGQIVAEEASKVAQGVERAGQIWDQAVKNTADKQVRTQLDAEQKAADAAKKRIKSTTEAEQKALEEKQKLHEKAKDALKKALDEETQLEKDHKAELKELADDELKEDLKRGDKELKDFTNDFKKKQTLAAQKVKTDADAYEANKKQTEEKAALEESAQKAGWNNTLQFADMMGEKNAEMFAVSKGLHIADATMATWAPAAEALKAGPVAGPIFAAITVAAGMANVASIASQQFTPVEDFIYSEQAGLIKFRKDDLIIGGTNLGGNGGGSAGGDMSRLIRLQQENNSILKRKQMAVSVNPLTGETVYKQSVKGQKVANRKRVL